MDSKIQQIINEWDIDGEEVKQIYDSAWQVGENAILKTYKEVNLLQRNIKILSMLEDIGIPVGRIILTKSQKNYAEDDEYYYILTKKLVGNNITDIQNNMQIALEMGRVLARLHKEVKGKTGRSGLSCPFILDKVQ